MQNGSAKFQIAILTAHLVTGMSVILAATVLGALHVLDGQAVTAIYGSALGFAGGGATAGTIAGQLGARAEQASKERLESERIRATENGGNGG